MRKKILHLHLKFYDLVNGNIAWKRDRSLPVDTLENETLDQFKQRVIDMLSKSTSKVVKVVNTDIKFA